MINLFKNMFSFAEGLTDLNAETFKSKMSEAEHHLIDVRSTGEFNSGNIAGAKNISFPSADFEKKVSKLDLGKPVFVYCRSGNRSKMAGKLLLEMGFKEVYNLSGGIMAWKNY